MSSQNGKSNQNREWLAAISTPESRRRGMAGCKHVLGKKHNAADCKRCEAERQGEKDDESN